MSRRTERVGEAIREVAASTILFDLKDPRVQGVTVTRAEVTGDLRHAKIYVSLMGDERQQHLSLRGLDSARGYLQRKIAERLETRYTPVVEIVVDDSIKKSLEMARLLKEVLPPEAETINEVDAANAVNVTPEEDADQDEDEDEFGDDEFNDDEFNDDEFDDHNLNEDEFSEDDVVEDADNLAAGQPDASAPIDKLPRTAPDHLSKPNSAATPRAGSDEATTKD